MAKKVGLLVGREWSFPPAFIEEVAKRDAGVTVEYVKLGATRWSVPARTPSSSTASRTRCRTTAPTSSTRCSRASRSSTTRSCGRPTTSSSARRWRPSSASPARRRSCCRTRTTCPASCTTRACATSSYPLDWEAHRRLRRLPCILKDAHGGGWKEVYVCHSLEELIHHYDDSGLLTMIVQEFIEWDQFVRCICLGQQEVLPMKYDPKRAALPRRRELPLAGARGADHRRLAAAGAGARLRHELDRVGDPRRRAVRDRLHEPGAGHGHQLAHARPTSSGCVKHMADMAIRLAQNRAAGAERGQLLSGERASASPPRQRRRRDRRAATRSPATTTCSTDELGGRLAAAADGRSFAGAGWSSATGRLHRAAPAVPRPPTQYRSLQRRVRRAAAGVRQGLRPRAGRPEFRAQFGLLDWEETLVDHDPGFREPSPTVPARRVLRRRRGHD